MTFRVVHRLEDPEFEGQEDRSQARRRPVRPPAADRTVQWQAGLASGAIASCAALARREGLSRARVTQILGRTSKVGLGDSASLPSRAH